ncbi:MAG: ATP-dependent sacrificial sulfur transferase LarE [Spirochaetota bacterium]
MNEQYKLERLSDILKGMESVLIAYSGGTDSALLLRVARDVLHPNLLAVTARSKTYPKRELDEARLIVGSLGVEHVVIDTDELNNESFAANPPERCYWCKRELLGRLVSLASERGLRFVAVGTNVDDQGDYRPGEKAVSELEVRSPLREAGLTKAEIRGLARSMGLPNWDKPAQACLASRFPYGTRITAERLDVVERAERVLASLGLSQFRVRYHGEVARIETLREEAHIVLNGVNAAEITARFREIGFRYVALDVQGYRTGSLNEVLEP